MFDPLIESKQRKESRKGRHIYGMNGMQLTLFYKQDDEQHVLYSLFDLIYHNNVVIFLTSPNKLVRYF